MASSSQFRDGFPRKRGFDNRHLRSRIHGDSALKITSPASSEATPGRSVTLDYEDSIDSHSVDSTDVFWSRLAKRSETSNVSTEKTYPMIRAIKERASRGFVHDEVQLNDDRIISEIYSNYIKKTKALLNNYIDPNLAEFFHRKSWFLDTGKEAETTGQEFAKFLQAKTKYKRNLVDNSQTRKEASSLSPESKRGGKQRSVRQRNVRFMGVPDSNRGSDQNSADGNATLMNNQCSETGDRQEMLLSSPSTAKDNDVGIPLNVKANIESRSRNAVLFTKSSDSRFKQGENDSRKSMLSIRGILKKESSERRLFVTARRTTNRPSVGRLRNETAGNEVKRRGGFSIRKGKYINAPESNEDRESFTRQESATPSSSNTWNRGMRLLRGIGAVSVLERRQKPKTTRKRPGNSSHLGVPNASVPWRRRSITPETSSQASNSPTRWQRGEMKGRSEPAHGIHKGHKRLGKLEKGSKRGDSQEKQGMEKQQHNDMGVGKIAEVTTVSSFVRYEFDIPDDLDENLEHLRLHGYLRE